MSPTLHWCFQNPSVVVQPKFFLSNNPLLSVIKGIIKLLYVQSPSGDLSNLVLLCDRKFLDGWSQDICIWRCVKTQYQQGLLAYHCRKGYGLVRLASNANPYALRWQSLILGVGEISQHGIHVDCGQRCSHDPENKLKPEGSPWPC